MVQIEVIALVLCRVLAFISLGPLFSQRDFPNSAKLILGVSLAMIAFPTAQATYVSTTTPIIFALLVIKEVLFGFTMGYLSQLVFNAVMIAGQIVDFQVGFTIAQAYDTTMQVQTSQYGKVYYWLAISMFFMLNLHQQLIRGVLVSFQIIPLGTAHFTGSTIDGITKMIVKTIEMGLDLAAPLVVALIAIDIILGVISRSIPQINVLMMSLPFKTGVSFIIFFILLSNVLSFLANYLPTSITQLMEFIRSVGNT
ncbi:flagellar biosynthetic protein FliR [Periweissella beninensis]|uniref:Flagellar biosynthetic protein FliR n=1 Tax=Periweissella beninensis TaxID=504936 RepID=A0ABT0VJA7_9LACO|nr:flagellar biosynthetic protein FliR [Periweissella beninensis]MBM7544706.1 flagellar biosynthetic protein FliR [Periweissella beninensis]MCM2436944.1 flagellar biosynthetic protein FliR [Periweissella beninensis]MCT4396331.1 flagellar biosynthetic protein FliR [Periweissella beninensis]